MRTNSNRADDMNTPYQYDFEATYRQFIKPVYYYAYSFLHSREEAEDITHDVFVSFFENDKANDVKNIKSYLLTMAKNKSLNKLKRNEREFLVDNILPFEKGRTDETPDCKSLLSKLEKELYLLPLEERQVLILHTKAGLKYREIASVLGLSLPATYRKYKKAIRILKEKLKGEEL